MPAGNILVADDDAAIRTVLNQALSRAGYEVRSTSNAATLWRWVSQGEGDLVISDVLMTEQSLIETRLKLTESRQAMWQALADLQGLMQLDIDEDLTIPFDSSAWR